MKSSLNLGHQAKPKVVMQLMLCGGTVLLILNVLLVQENKQLRVQASKPDRALEIKPGTSLPSLEGLDSNGVWHSFDYGQDSRKTVLFVLSPTCQACKDNMPNLKAIINGIDRHLFRPVAVSLQADGYVKEYTNMQDLNQIPILTKIDPKYRVSYNLALTPQTILINTSGKVEKVWTGLLRGKDKQDVEMALNVQLP